MQNLQVIISRYKIILNYISSLLSFRWLSPLCLNMLWLLGIVHCFARNSIAEENQLLGNTEKIQCNWRFDIWETGITEVVTVTKLREKVGNWKKICCNWSLL
jgi:hypothetical protein